MRGLRAYRAAVPILIALAGSAGAQTAPVTVQGRAFGSFFAVNGDPVEELNTADTGSQSATEPGSFSRSEDDQFVDARPIATVDASGSATAGNAAGADSNLDSGAGNAAVEIAPGETPDQDFIDAVTSGATVAIDCDNFVHTSGIKALSIAGQEVGLPGSVPPNTTITGEDLPLLVLNEQPPEDCRVNPATGSAFCTVNALHAHVVPGSDPELIEAVVSSAFGRIDNLPSDCPIFQNVPNLNGMKTAAIVEDGGNAGVADPGDRIRYTIEVTNTAAVAGTDLQVIDRIPLSTTLDAASVSSGDAEATATQISCPATPAFTKCPGEASSDPSRECLRISGGDLAAGATRTITFDVTVDGDAEGSVCNDAGARVEESDWIEMLAIVEGGSGFTPPPGGGDILKTAGSGCSLTPGSRGRGDAWPLGVIALVLVIRARVRSRPS